MLESRESSSPILTRAINAGLQGKYSDSYLFGKSERAALRLMGALPQSFAKWIIPRFQTQSALTYSQIEKVSLTNLVSERLADYTNLKWKFRSITMGLGIGGAAGHLALALNSPFLPQSFVLTLRGGTKLGDIQEYFCRSIDIARGITKRNPQLISIQHFDPIHDGWLTRSVNHLRLKLIELPIQYKRFIKKYLEPGGEIVFFEGKTRWLQYVVGDYNYFQVGGWGGISSHEFIEGSERISKFRKENNLGEEPWKLTENTPILGFESEWGSAPEFVEDIEGFCQSEGFKIIRISFDNPHDFAKLAFFSQKMLLEKNEIEPRGLIIEMFSQYDLTAVREAGLLPLWLIFNTHDSLNFLKEMTRYFPKDIKIFFSPLATFSMTPDMVSYGEWEESLNSFQWDNIGCRSTHYPADARALISWAEPLRAWSKQNKVRLEKFLSGEDLSRISDSIKR